MSRQLHFTSPGLRTQVLAIAPDSHDDIPPSKRYGLIEHEDQNLNQNLGELERGTKARNRAYQERLDEIWRSTAGWEGKLRVERQEAEESIVALRHEYQKHIDTFSKLLVDEVTSAFDHIDNDLYPCAPQHLDVMDKSLDNFVDHSVPDKIEELVGQVSRKLKKEYEYFNIEQQKEAKRETKIVMNANIHIQKTAQRFTDEEALLTACFYNLEDDVLDTERRTARMYERKKSICTKSILELRKVIQEENEIRQIEDADLLDTVIETQSLLQHTILEHFGMSKEEGDGSAGAAGNVIKFEKLQNRLDKISARSESKGDAETGEEKA